MRNLLYAATAITALALTPAAHADLILTFGQVGNANTITGTVNAAQTQTTITGTNVLVNVTQILGGTPSVNDFLNLSATSVGAAFGVGSAVGQHFNGSFTITTGANGTGTNLLSGSFTDLLLGAGPSATITVGAPPDTANFTSAVITELALPAAVSFSFANVSPVIGEIGTTLAAFSAGVSGDFSASAAPVPEPASMALLGVGLLGLGFVANRKRSV